MRNSYRCVTACMIASLALATGSASGQVCTGQVGYWPLDGTGVDLSGTGNHGSLVGSPLFVTGVAGLAMNLDGADDSVFVPDHPSLNPSAAMSISAWYRGVPFSGSGNDPIVDKAAASHSPPYYQYHLGLSGSEYGHSPGSVGITFALAGGNGGAGTDQRFIQNGQWTHFVAVYDGTRAFFYADGVLISSNPASGPIMSFGQPLRFGRFNNLFFHLPGAIDEIRIFDRALSAEEASLLHDYPDGRPAAAPANAGACAGSTVTLHVRMLQDPAATYQWRKDGVDLDGETGPTLTIPNARSSDQGSYDCLVTGPCATALSAPAMLTLCATDFNCDGETNPDDLGDFITCYFSEPACAGADFNADNDVNPDDLGDFITAYFGPGC